MRFDGQVWFDFSDPGVWHFYRFVRQLAAEGHEVALEWLPRPSDREAEAMSIFMSLDDPQDRGRFLHAMLGLVHLESEDAADDATITRAMDAARLTMTEAGAEPDLSELTARAESLGVSAVPAMYRHGPVVTVTLNGAALLGDVAQRAETIQRMLDDDGIWSMSKP